MGEASANDLTKQPTKITEHSRPSPFDSLFGLAPSVSFSSLLSWVDLLVALPILAMVERRTTPWTRRCFNPATTAEPMAVAFQHMRRATTTTDDGGQTKKDPSTHDEETSVG
jgi:hypothetical protein